MQQLVASKVDTFCLFRTVLFGGKHLTSIACPLAEDAT